MGLSLLKNDPKEQRQDIHLPYYQYLKLEKSWYPYLAYDGAAEIVSVVTAHRVLHEGSAFELGRMVSDGA
ncbi:hypothetical protein V1506DRAFT_517690 [Lipomyces tetrasporus]